MHITSTCCKFTNNQQMTYCHCLFF